MSEKCPASDGLVVVIDDTEVNAKLMGIWLEDAGFTDVRIYTNPNSALIDLPKIKPDLIVLDWHMYGVSGADVLKHIREGESTPEKVPVLVWTADTTTESKREALLLGATDFITKPADSVEVVKRVQNLLESRRLRQQLEGYNTRLETKVRERTEELERINKALEIETLSRRKIEGDLRKTEQRLRFLMSTGSVTIYSCEPFAPFRPTFVGPNVLEMLGYEPCCFLNEPSFWLDHVHPDDQAKVATRSRDSRQAEGVIEYRFLRNDGEYRWISDNPHPILDSAGSAVEIIGGWIDITDRVRGETALAEHACALTLVNKQLEEYNRMKSEFVATASHEMRTPLTVIREFASQFADGLSGDLRGDQAEMVAAMIRNCDRLRDLLDNLLDLRQIEAGQQELRLSKTDLSSMFEECFQDFEPKCKLRNIELSRHLESDVPAVWCDSAQIQQVVVNLIGNAAKFVQSGGSIALKGRLVGEMVEVSVVDNGPGISLENLDRVFKPFSQIDRADGPGAKGTGLGLTISKSIVEMHGSDLTLESEVGVGSNFSFNLPLWRESREKWDWPTNNVELVGPT